MEKIKPTILDLRISAQIFSRFLLVFSIIPHKLTEGGSFCFVLRLKLVHFFNSIGIFFHNKIQHFFKLLFSIGHIITSKLLYNKP